MGFEGVTLSLFWAWQQACGQRAASLDRITSLTAAQTITVIKKKKKSLGDTAGGNRPS